MSFGSCYLLVRVSILSNNSLNWYQISIFGHHFRCSSIVLIFLKDSASYLIGFHYFLYVLLFSALLLISDYNYGLTYFSSSSINFCLMCVIYLVFYVFGTYLSINSQKSEFSLNTSNMTGTLSISEF